MEQPPRQTTDRTRVIYLRVSAKEHRLAKTAAALSGYESMNQFCHDVIMKEVAKYVNEQGNVVATINQLNNSLRAHGAG